MKKSLAVATRLFRLTAELSAALIMSQIQLCAQEIHTEHPKTFIGFDRNDYPGDVLLPALKQHFDFTGYWLTNPPGEQQNSWVGKRAVLRAQGFGFLVLANGKLDAEIKAHGKDATGLGRSDGTAAAAAAVREGFAPKTVLFLDQEEGGRLLPEQAAYLFGWTEAVAEAGFQPGVYLSGQKVDEGHGESITTAQDVSAQVVSRHLHPITFWVYQDACPPSNGCTLRPPPLQTNSLVVPEVWQYAQSPRRRESTASCAKTYAADGNCYVHDSRLTGVFVDLNVAGSADPSHGR